MERILGVIFILAAFAVAGTAYAEDPPTMVWDEIFDYSGYEDWGGEVAVDALGSIYVTGTVNDGTDLDWFTIKYNSNGDTVWTRTYDSDNGEDVACGITVDNSGNVYVVGWYSNGIDYDWKVTKYDSEGNEEWTDERDDGQDEGAHSVAVDAAGYIYVTGDNFINTSFDYQTIKYDADGNVLWQKTFDSGISEGAWAIALDFAGNIYVSGQGHSGVDFDLITIKYDENGDTVWTATYDSGTDDLIGCNAIAVDNSGNIYVGGWSSNTTTDWQIVKYDADGNYVWDKVIDSGYDEGANDVEVDATGYIYVHGDFAKATDWDCRTIKYDTDGNIVWETIYDSGMNDAGRGVTVDAAGYVYAVGASDVQGTTDYLTVKYAQHSGVAEPSSEPPSSSSVTLEVVDNLSNTPTLNYSMPARQRGTLTFYSADGRKLDRYTLDPAQSEFSWSTDNPSGVYFAQLVAGRSMARSKIILID